MLKLIILIFHTALRFLFIYTGEALAWFLGKQQPRFNLLNIILLILGIITIFIYVKIFNIVLRKPFQIKIFSFDSCTKHAPDLHAEFAEDVTCTWLTV